MIDGRTANQAGYAVSRLPQKTYTPSPPLVATHWSSSVSSEKTPTETQIRAPGSAIRRLVFASLEKPDPKTPSLHLRALSFKVDRPRWTRRRLTANAQGVPLSAVHALMPLGFLPTFTEATTLRVARSIAVTVPSERPVT